MSPIVITLVVALGLIFAAVMRARAVSRVKPVLEVAAKKHQASIHHSVLGMPHVIKTAAGQAMRLTLMTVSISSPEGGGEMACVDFDLPRVGIGEFRIREKADAKRNAMPAVLMGGNATFSLGIPQVDERFLMVAAHPKDVSRMLAETALVASIVDLPRGADIRVKDGRCYVAVKGFPYHIDTIDRLFAVSEQLLAAFRRMRE